MLSVTFFYCHADCYNAKCRYAECQYAECRGADLTKPPDDYLACQGVPKVPIACVFKV